MFRDKDYIQTDDLLTFNVLGYHHPYNVITAGLKYINGHKWTGSYFEALDFLAANFPHYVTDRIIVPRDRVAKHFQPRERFAEILADPPRTQCLHRLMIELAKMISRELEIRLTAIRQDGRRELARLLADRILRTVACTGP
jgi:predicted nucleotidyltransferase